MWVRVQTKNPLSLPGICHLPSLTYYSLLLSHCERELSFSGNKQGRDTQPFLTGVRTENASEGYKDVVIHVSLLEVVHDGVLVDLAEQDHVIHAALFDIVALPVVPVVPPAPLKQTNTQCTVYRPLRKTQRSQQI